jgi:hypothetical protein
MRKFLALMAVVLLVSSTGIAFAKVTGDSSPSDNNIMSEQAGGNLNDVPARNMGYAKVDTVKFGYFTTHLDGTKWAVLNGEWTFDHGASGADSSEGWTSYDNTANDRAYFRQMTQAKWTAEGGPLPWPGISGHGMALLGASKAQGDSLGWVTGIGYANSWCQRLVSPNLAYNGTGTATLDFMYFNDSETEYDYTKVFVKAGSTETILNEPGFNNKVGVDGAGVLTPQSFHADINNLQLGGPGARDINIVFHFVSDGGWSDQDGYWDSFYGPFGVDSVRINGPGLGNHIYGFETDLQGWTPEKCQGIGTYMGVSNMGRYVITDPCVCALTGNVLEMHNNAREHPEKQYEVCVSPIVDRKGLIGNGSTDYLAYNRFMAEWDQYADLPRINATFYRANWIYYPWVNPAGMTTWSSKLVQKTWYYTQGTAACRFNRDIATDAGIPSAAEQVRFLYEINTDCTRILPTVCSGATNFTPLIDNISVRNVGYVAAPVAQYQPGTQFQDGFGQSAIGILSSTDPGNADITGLKAISSNINGILGDSLMVKGPTPTNSNVNTRWEAKLWWRLKRMGPGQATTNFTTWQNFFATNPTKPINFWSGTNPNFAWGYMDSCEVGITNRVAKGDQFCSQFREATPGQPTPPGATVVGEPYFCLGNPAAGDESDVNEILPDGLFTPGTKIEYFVTTNYVHTPTAYYVYPDTTGKFYQEFEILPSYRLDGGIPKFPCILYVDAFNNGAQFYIENALNVVLNGAVSGAPVPDPTAWDRYDYLDSSSNWNGPLYRGIGGTSGATLPQLLGYKLVMVNTGTNPQGTMESRDWQGFRQWMEAVACNGNANVQGFIANGSRVSEMINADYPYLLQNTLGATVACTRYSDYGCLSGETQAQNDQQFCVRLEPAAGSPFGAGIPSDISGNWCPTSPAISSQNVLGVTGTGQGNKVFEKVNDGYQTNYAEVINDKMAPGANYRSVIDAFSYHLLLERGTPGLGECVYSTTAADSAAKVTAVYTELRNALKWTLNISDPRTQVGLCINPCSVEDVPGEEAVGVAVTRLYQNHPNPFNPRTSIKFSLAADCPTKLVIYDVNGRRVRTLVNESLKAGTHERIWDGMDDAGHVVTSGVYWSQLQAGSYSSNKKMVVLK